MSRRYRKMRSFINDSEMYDKTFEDRGIKQVSQYPTPKLKPLTPVQRSKIPTVDHVWTLGDKYYKLSQKYYGSPNYWWIIAQFNFAPTEAHLFQGRVLKIPVPLENIMRFYS